MRERDRQTIRQFLEDERAEEQRREEERLRPIKAAQQQFDETYRQLHEIERENIQNLPDPDIFVSPEVRQARMTWNQAVEYNQKQLRAFLKATPDLLPSETNRQTLRSYFGRAGIQIVTAEMWSRALEKLRAYGLIEERPPEPQPEPIPALEPVPAAPQQPELHDGVDFATGLPRSYTAREVERMTSREYVQAFQLYGENKPVFIDPRFA
jgi:hypothetical protein